MTMTLLPHELQLLRACWVKSSCFPEQLDMSAARLRETYAGRLAEKVAEWLEIGMLGWQFPLRRSIAFLPVAWLIGTRPEDDSYLDALVEMGEELKFYIEPEFERVNEELHHEAGEVRLGNVYADGAARAVLRLATGLASAKPEASGAALNALLDALDLVERLQPDRVVTPLSEAWQALFQTAEPVRGPLLSPRDVLCVQQAFVRALYPAMHAGRDSKILPGILDAFQATIDASQTPLPAALSQDIALCRKRLRGEWIDDARAIRLGPALAAGSMRAVPANAAPASRPADAKPTHWGIAYSGRDAAAKGVQP